MRPKPITQLAIALLLALPLMLSCGQKQADNQQGSGPQGNATQGSQQTVSTSDAAQQIVTDAPKEAAVRPETSAFVGVEKRLIDTLLAMWEMKGHLTSIDQAAKIVGVDVTDSMRIEMFRKLGENLTLSEKLNRYRPTTFVLTNQEKWIAQDIVNAQRRMQEFPAAEQIAADLKIAVPEVKSRLKFLANIGLLYDLGKPDAANRLGYSFGADLSSFTYDMGLRYHTFYVDDKPPFNVGCAKEALYLIATDLAGDRVRYETNDILSLTPVVVVFNQGQIESVAPPDARMVEGGSCGQNNLFASQAEAQTWVNAQPRIAQRQVPPVYDIREHLAQITEQLQQQSGGK